MVHFSGHVQGVGFRYTVCRMAQRFAVVGQVENLDDGRVRLVAEGQPGELALFVEAIQQQMGDFIRQTQVDHQPANGQFGMPLEGQPGVVTIRR